MAGRRFVFSKTRIEKGPLQTERPLIALTTTLSGASGPVLSVDPRGRIGIGQAATTEALEVTGIMKTNRNDDTNSYDLQLWSTGLTTNGRTVGLQIGRAMSSNGMEFMGHRFIVRL